LSAKQGKVLNDIKLSISDINDSLLSSSNTTALSANQGKVLDNKKIDITNIVDSLASTDTTKPLSANQGKVINTQLIESINHGHTNTLFNDHKSRQESDYVNIKDFGAVGNANYRKSDKTYWVDALFTIPAHDDTQSFKDAISYIMNNNLSTKLFIPDGNYLTVNLSMIIDIAHIKLIGGNNTRIVSTNLVANSKHVTITSSNGVDVYNNMKDAIMNITFEGSYFQQNSTTNSGIVCIYLDPSVLTPHMIFPNVVVKWFNIGMRQGVNSYKELFAQCSFIANDTAVKFDNAPGTGGIPIDFVDCYFECNTLVLDNQNVGTGEIHFRGGSMEYNARIMDIYSYVTMQFVHFEGDLTMSGDSPFRIYLENDRARLTIKDCWFLTLNNGIANVSSWITNTIIYPQCCDYLFEIIVPSDVSFYGGGYGLDIENTTMTMNQVPLKKSLIGGNGAIYSKVKLHGDMSMVLNGCLINASNSDYYNSDFLVVEENYGSVLKLTKWYVTNRDATSQPDRFNTGGNISFDIDSGHGVNNDRCLKIVKVANSTNGAVGLVIPVTCETKGILLKFSYKLHDLLLNSNSNIVAKLYCGSQQIDYANANKYFFTFGQTLMAVSGSFANSTSYNDIYCYAKIPKASANHYLLEINLNGATETTDIQLYIDNVIVNLM